MPSLTSINQSDIYAKALRDEDDYIEKEWKQSTYRPRPYKTPKQRPKVNRDERFHAILGTLPRAAFNQRCR